MKLGGLDKLMIQYLLYRCSVEQASFFYRNILLFVPGAAAVLSFASLLALVVVTKWKHIKDWIALHLCPSRLQVQLRDYFTG